MLPGFRFLSAAILLSISILVFGIGAAALLRTTHEQLTSDPSSWRNRPQEQVLTKAPEPPAQSVLAILRIEPVPVPATSPQDQVPTAGLPANEPEQATAANSDETAKKDVAEAPQLLQRKGEVETPGEPASPDAATSAKVDISPTPTPTETPASESTAATAEVLAPASTLAKSGDAPSSGPQQADTTPAPASAPDSGMTATATLNYPTATAEKEPAAKTTPDGDTPATTAAKRPARRTKKRMARRPPQPQQQVQPLFFPFGDPSPANTH